jgi:hypothetical protein
MIFIKQTNYNYPLVCYLSKQRKRKQEKGGSVIINNSTHAKSNLELKARFGLN